MLENAYKLSTGDKCILKRSLGKRLSESPSHAGRIFYSHFGNADCVDDSVFLCACIFCAQEKQSNKTFQEQWRSFSKTDDYTDSMDNRILKLLDMEMRNNNDFYRCLAKLVILLNNKGYYINCEALANDLKFWNANNKSIQRKWLRTIYAPIED